MCAGVAVGSGWQALVAYVNIGTYYLIGVPLGVLLGWTLNLGVLVCFSNLIRSVRTQFSSSNDSIKMLHSAGHLGWNDCWNSSSDGYLGLHDDQM